MNRFNGGSDNSSNLSDGTVNAVLASLKIQGLTSGFPVKIGSDNKLVSEKINASDINGTVLVNPFNDTLVVDDLETSEYFSLNTELQKIDNFEASTALNTNLSGILNTDEVSTDEVSTDKLYDKSKSVWIDLDATDISVNGNFVVNGDNIASQISVLENKCQNIIPQPINSALTRLVAQLQAPQINTSSIKDLSQTAGILLDSTSINIDADSLRGRGSLGTIGDPWTAAHISTLNSFTVNCSNVVANGNNLPDLIASNTSNISTINGNLTVVQNKCQNISTTTSAGNTKSTGNQQILLGDSLTGDTFSVTGGVIGDAVFTRILDLNGQGINAVVPLNTSLIRPDVNNIRDIGASSLKYRDLYTTTVNATTVDATTVNCDDFNLNSDAVALGTDAGKTNQGTNTVAIGYKAGEREQKSSTVAIGRNSGSRNQSVNAVAIGNATATNGQGQNSVAIGLSAANTNQGNQSISIGMDAGRDSQRDNSIALGLTTAQNRQGGNSIAIGASAARNDQGDNCIAIGTAAGVDNQHDNSIVLNSSGVALNTTSQNSLYIKPIREATNVQSLKYNTTSGEITYENMNAGLPPLTMSSYTYNADEVKKYIENISGPNKNASAPYVPYPSGVTVVAGDSYSESSYSPTENRIYMSPRNQSAQATWHYINCDTGFPAAYTHGSTNVVANAYIDLTYSPQENKMYMCPFGQSNQTKWHYIDNSNGSLVEYDAPSISTTNAYVGGIYSPKQDIIYFVPFEIAAEAVWHYIDCSDGIAKHILPHLELSIRLILEGPILLQKTEYILLHLLKAINLIGTTLTVQTVW